MAFTDDYTASLNPIVQAQVRAAFYAAAVNVFGETPPSDHTQRVLFGTNVLNGNVNWLSLTLGVCAFAHLTTASSDTTVSNAVAAMWSAFSGA
jgi:hypothetical protein